MELAPTTCNEDLARLLADLFSGSEIRRFVALTRENLDRDLNGSSASALAESAADLFFRLGLVDDLLFRRLIEECPSRAYDIQRCQDILTRPILSQDAPTRGREVQRHTASPDTGGSRREYDIFLSYDRADRDKARRVCDLLEARGLRIWFDDWALGPHHRVDEGVIKGVSSCPWFLALVTKHYTRSWTGVECGQALAHHPDRVIVLRDRGATPPGPLLGRSWEPINLRTSDHEMGRALDVVAALVRGTDFEAVRRRWDERTGRPSGRWKGFSSAILALCIGATVCGLGAWRWWTARSHPVPTCEIVEESKGEPGKLRVRIANIESDSLLAVASANGSDSIFVQKGIPAGSDGEITLPGDGLQGRVLVLLAKSPSGEAWLGQAQRMAMQGIPATEASLEKADVSELCWGTMPKTPDAINNDTQAGTPKENSLNYPHSAPPSEKQACRLCLWNQGVGVNETCRQSGPISCGDASIENLSEKVLYMSCADGVVELTIKGRPSVKCSSGMFSDRFSPAIYRLCSGTDIRKIVFDKELSCQ